MTFQEFKYYVGETVMFCQIIESDLKIIYVNLINGNKQETWTLIQKETLGSMVKMLQNLDSDNRLLSKNDYHYLHQLVGKRNHWCHQTFVNFLYNGQDFLNSKQYIEECNLLAQDHEQLSKIYRILEGIRVDLVRANRK